MKKLADNIDLIMIVGLFAIVLYALGHYMAYYNNIMPKGIQY